MKQELRCIIGSHKYEVYKEEDVKLAGTDIIVAKTIISRCSNCGKIKCEEIPLTTYNY